MTDANPSPDLPRNIIVGQHVDEAKLKRAKELRKLMTPEERIIWNHVRNNKIKGLHFRRQQIIDGFIADFYCHAIGLVVEIDGPVHERESEYDGERDRVINRRHLRVIRFSNEDVRQRLGWVLEQIELACAPDASTPPPAPPRSGEGS